VTPRLDPHPLDDLAVYALDALDGPERTAVERHVAGCSQCTAELDVLRTTVAELAPSEPAPAHLWGRIAAAVAAPDPAPSPLPGPSAVPQPSRRSRRTWARARAFAAAAVVAGLVGFVTGRAADDPPSGDLAHLAQAAAADPHSVSVAMTDPSDRQVARLIVDEPTAYLLFEELPQLPEERSYQLWSLDGTTPISLGVLDGSSAAAAAVTLPPGTSRLALTIEPVGGVPSPTGPLVARGTVPAPA
jgi:anti-sigma-K factor RskA